MTPYPDNSLDWPAPAKLNLFLHIVGRRNDGYHRLQTIFQLLDYGDSLRFAIRSDCRVSRCGNMGGVAEEDDLTIRAAKLLQQECGISKGVDIQIMKRLPMGGGLGGGSSDAATTLAVLNQLWRCNLTQEQLIVLGASLGADVPVFLFGYSAWAEGIGERLQSIELPEHWYVVIKPLVEVSTAELFSAPELTRNCKPITISTFFSGSSTNVFEPLVRKRYPVIAQATDWLDHYAKARMTGTGSCVFAAFETRGSAERVMERLPGGWEGFVARGVNKSPLFCT